MHFEREGILNSANRQEPQSAVVEVLREEAGKQCQI